MFDCITTPPAILNGKPTIRRVIEALAVTANWNDLGRDYPALEPEDIDQTLIFAANTSGATVGPRRHP